MPRPISYAVFCLKKKSALDLEHGLVVSCNAYFAQLGTSDVGAQALHGTTELLRDAGSHSCVHGRALYAGSGREIAFSVVVENGVFGGPAATPAVFFFF